MPCSLGAAKPDLSNLQASPPTSAQVVEAVVQQRRGLERRQLRPGGWLQDRVGPEPGLIVQLIHLQEEGTEGAAGRKKVGVASSLLSDLLTHQIQAARPPPVCHGLPSQSHHRVQQMVVWVEQAAEHGCPRGRR